MDKTDKPSQGMLNFIRELLSQHMSAERAKNLSDDEIAWIAPLVMNKLNHIRLTERNINIIILRYGLFGREPLSYEEVGIQVGEKKPLLRERVRQIEAKALKKIHQYMTELNDEETDKVLCNLQADVQEHLLDATRAYVAGDSISEEVYDHYWTVGTDAINKLKIQQDIRKYRERTE